jgi:hypothetical protein
VIVTDCPGVVVASAADTAAGVSTACPDTATISSPGSSLPCAGEFGTRSLTTTRVGRRSSVSAATSALASEAANCSVFSC